MPFFTLLFLFAGLATVTAAWIWLIVIAFRDKDNLWGTLLIAGIFVPPFAPIIYTILNWRRCSRAAITFYSGCGLSVIALVTLFAGLKNTIENSPEIKAAIAQAQAQAENQTAARAGRTPSSKAPDALPSVPTPSPEPPVADPKPAPAKPIAVAPKLPAPPAPRPAQVQARPAAVDPSIPPAELSTLSISDAGPNQLRTLRVQLANLSPRPIRELKLDLTYLDARGERLGGWTTVHSGTGSLAEAQSTNEFTMTAFFVPRFTEKIRIGVATAVFTDNSRWP